MARKDGAGTGQQSDRLRHETDRGRFADKVDFGDPATAPLGTDDEAAGHPPDREAVAASREQQERIARRVRDSTTDALAPQGAPAVSYAGSAQKRPARNWLIPALAGLAVAALVAAAIWLTFPA